MRICCVRACALVYTGPSEPEKGIGSLELELRVAGSSSDVGAGNSAQAFYKGSKGSKGCKGLNRCWCQHPSQWAVVSDSTAPKTSFSSSRFPGHFPCFHFCTKVGISLSVSIKQNKKLRVWLSFDGFHRSTLMNLKYWISHPHRYQAFPFTLIPF